MRKLLIAVAVACASTPVWLAGSTNPAQATFIGLNGKISFASSQDPPDERSRVKGGPPAFLPDSDIWVMSPDGGAQLNLTPDSSAADGTSDWSADGTQLVFASLRDGNAEIYVMKADGTGVRRLTNDPATDSQAAWSPDGASVVFVSFRTGNSEIFVMNADGSNVRQLTSNVADDNWPQFSPDGSRVLFTSNRNGASALYTVPLGGGAPTKLTPDALQAGQGDYSPDGERIVLVNNLCGTCAESDIFTMTAGGQEVEQLTHDFENNLNPKWSPDGTKIVFWNAVLVGSKLKQVLTSADIFVMYADGSGLRNLTRTPGKRDVLPDWGTNLG